MRYVYQPVERIPKPLRDGVVYYSEEFEIGALLCACGCGHRVSLLVPDSHRVTSDGGFATIRPSISVCDAPCKSHFVISSGEVEWYSAFSDVQAASVMRSQIARHADRDVKTRSLHGRLWAALLGAFNRVRSVLRI